MTAEALRRHRRRRAVVVSSREDPRPYPGHGTGGADDAHADVLAGEGGGPSSHGGPRRRRPTAHAPPSDAARPGTNDADGADGTPSGVARPTVDAPPAGGTRRYVSTWLWAPGAALALGLTLAGFTAAAPAGLAVSALATVAHSTLARARGIRS
jgi:hypothetical protein